MTGVVVDSADILSLFEPPDEQTQRLFDEISDGMDFLDDENFFEAAQQHQFGNDRDDAESTDASPFGHFALRGDHSSAAPAVVAHPPVPQYAPYNPTAPSASPSELLPASAFTMPSSPEASGLWSSDSSGYSTPEGSSAPGTPYQTWASAANSPVAADAAAMPPTSSPLPAHSSPATASEHPQHRKRRTGGAVVLPPSAKLSQLLTKTMAMPHEQLAEISSEQFEAWVNQRVAELGRGLTKEEKKDVTVQLRLIKGREWAANHRKKTRAVAETEREQIARLQSENAALKTEVATLRARCRELEEQLVHTSASSAAMGVEVALQAGSGLPITRFGHSNNPSAGGGGGGGLFSFFRPAAAASASPLSATFHPGVASSPVVRVGFALSIFLLSFGLLLPPHDAHAPPPPGGPSGGRALHSVGGVLLAGFHWCQRFSFFLATLCFLSTLAFVAGRSARRRGGRGLHAD